MRLHRLTQVLSDVQYLVETDLPFIDTVFIQPESPLPPANWCSAAAKNYATTHLNTKSPKSFHWSHRRSFAKSSLVKGSLGRLLWTGIKRLFASASESLWVKAVKAPFTQRNQCRTENALCGGGGGGGGRLANRTGSHFVALAESAGIDPEPKYDLSILTCVHFLNKRVLIRNLGKRRKCLLVPLQAQNVHSVKGLFAHYNQGF